MTIHRIQERTECRLGDGDQPLIIFTSDPRWLVHSQTASKGSSLVCMACRPSRRRCQQESRRSFTLDEREHARRATGEGPHRRLVDIVARAPEELYPLFDAEARGKCALGLQSEAFDRR
jgi:hypothetical protein